MNKISTEELFKIAYNHLQNKNYNKSIELFNKILKSGSTIITDSEIKQFLTFKKLQKKRKLK